MTKVLIRAISNLINGVATGITSNTLTDTSKSWTTNSLAGRPIIITSGTGLGQFRVIQSNTANTITIYTSETNHFYRPWGKKWNGSSYADVSSPVSGSGYMIFNWHDWGISTNFLKAYELFAPYTEISGGTDNLSQLDRGGLFTFLTGGIVTQLNHALVNEYDCVIHSFTGQATDNIALSYYPGIQIFQGIWASSGRVNEGMRPFIVTSDGEVSNSKGYDIDFHDIGGLLNPADSQISYANGYIAGKVSCIKDSLDCSWWEARFRAMETGSNNGTQPNGYGIIDVTGAISFAGSIDADVFVQTLGSIGSIVAVNVSGSVTVTIGAVSNATAYDVYKNGSLWKSKTTLLEFSDTIIQGQSITYSYKAYRGTQESALSSLEVLAYPFEGIGVVGQITAVNNKGIVNGTIDAIEDATVYDVYMNDEIIYTGSLLTFQEPIGRRYKGQSQYRFEYRGRNTEFTTPRSLPVTVNHYMYKKILIGTID